MNHKNVVRCHTTFWVGRGCFFLGGRGRGRGSVRAGLLSRFRRTTHTFKQPHFLCYILYIEQWRYSWCMFQTIEKSVLDLDALGRHVSAQASTTRRPVPHTEEKWEKNCTSWRKEERERMVTVSMTSDVVNTPTVGEAVAPISTSSGRTIRRPTFYRDSRRSYLAFLFSSCSFRCTCVFHFLV
jgi:hypothetical protein